MKSKILLPLIAGVAILIASIGAVSLNGSFNTSNSLNSNTLNKTPQFHDGLMPGFMGIGNKYHGLGWAVSNRQQLGNVVQCKTSFVDNAAPVASNFLGVSLSTSGLDSANSKLQSDISGNASIRVLKGDLITFRGESMVLFGEAFGAVKNRTQGQALVQNLSVQLGQLQTCISGNTILNGNFTTSENVTHMHMPIRHMRYVYGFGR